MMCFKDMTIIKRRYQRQYRGRTRAISRHVCNFKTTLLLLLSPLQKSMLEWIMSLRALLAHK